MREEETMKSEDASDLTESSVPRLTFNEVPLPERMAAWGRVWEYLLQPVDSAENPDATKENDQLDYRAESTRC
jgi:hypothetical protein